MAVVPMIERMCCSYLKRREASIVEGGFPVKEYVKSYVRERECF